jgi:hypothetical protein
MARSSKLKTDAERLGAYVAGFFERRKKWPTVRQCARALRWTQARVEEATGDESYGGRLFLSSLLSMVDSPLGDHFVEHLELMNPWKQRQLRRNGPEGS